MASIAVPRGALMSKSERDKRLGGRERTYFMFYSAYIGPLAASFSRKMHIGYFYDDGRENAQRRLAVFRDVSFEKGGYSAPFGSGDFNVGEKMI